MKNHYGILGREISYTLSPRLHKIIFKNLNIDGEYEIIDTANFSDEELAVMNTIGRLKNGELKGINVTIPYKEKIISYLDGMDEIAKKLGAVNTIKNENGKLVGYNTDYYGIKETIKEMKLDLNGKIVYIFGTGGSSKAVEKVIKDLGGDFLSVSRSKSSEKIISYEKLKGLNQLELGVNCTPVYLDIEIESKFKFFFDLKYKRDCKRWDSKEERNFIDGLYMLVVQGIKSQEIWQNRKIGDYKEVYRELCKNL